MPLTTGLQLPYGVQPVNPVPVDTWSGPYTGAFDTVESAKEAANASISSSIRFKSMEVRLIVDGTARKFWYESGTTDSDLVEFSGGGTSVLFTSSFFKGEALSKITCSAYYSYYHLSTQNDLNIKLTGSKMPSAFSIRLVNSGSVSHRVQLSPYNTIEWAGVASGFDNTGSILMAGNQELFFSFIFYDDAGIGRPVSKSIAFITDLKTPGLQNKTTAQNLYILGEGLSGMVSGSINDPNTYLFTADGGGTEPSAAGLTSKPFWGWMPVYVEGYGRKFLPLYE